MIDRGVAYEINGTGKLGVVLTKDSWNRRMLNVGVVPISPKDDERTSPLALPLDDDPSQCLDPARLLALPRERLGRPRLALDDASLHRLERAVAELIDAERMTRRELRATKPPAGKIDYPRWGEIYYPKSERIAGETKRYLVVSNDLWNQQKRTVLICRTTTQEKYPADEFPVIQGGAAQAICGDLAAISPHHLNLDRRPQGQTRLGLQDMASVVRGVTHTHLLRDYLDDPMEIEAASLE
jgi:mRNA-degrading endonuclease toxin of MazEF toxin-antitoxin module